MRAIGMPYWMVAITVRQAASTVGKAADRGRDRLRDALQAERQLGDDAERALRADQEPRQVVAGGGLLRAVRRLDQRPSGITAVRFSTLSFIVP